MGPVEFKPILARIWLSLLKIPVLSFRLDTALNPWFPLNSSHSSLNVKKVKPKFQPRSRAKPGAIGRGQRVLQKARSAPAHRGCGINAPTMMGVK